MGKDKYWTVVLGNRLGSEDYKDEYNAAPTFTKVEAC